MTNQDSISDMIEHWMNIFGDSISDTINIPSEAELTLATKLIKEESEEYYESIKDSDNIDITEVADALGDTVWVSIRAMRKFGLDPVKVMQTIYVSNMSKTCNVNTLRPTIKKYNAEGISVKYDEVAPGVFVVRRDSDNKILKNIDWSEPNFSWITNDITKKNN